MDTHCRENDVSLWVGPGQSIGHPHPISRGMGCTLLHLEKGNCSKREFLSTTPSQP